MDRIPSHYMTSDSIALVNTIGRAQIARLRQERDAKAVEFDRLMADANHKRALESDAATIAWADTQAN